MWQMTYFSTPQETQKKVKYEVSIIDFRLTSGFEYIRPVQKMDICCNWGWWFWLNFDSRDTWNGQKYAKTTTNTNDNADAICANRIITIAGIFWSLNS